MIKLEDNVTELNKVEKSDIKNTAFQKDIMTKTKDSFKIGGGKSNGKKNGYVKGLGITGVILLTLGSILALVLFLFIISPALAVKSKVDALKVDMSNISTALSTRDLVELEKVMQVTSTDLDNLRNTRDEKFGWARNLKMFQIGEFYSDSDRFINAGHLSIDALRETARIVTPFADAAGLRISEEQEVSQEEGLMEAFQTWVSIMPQVANEMDGVLVILDKIGEELAPIDTTKYPEKIRGVVIRDNVEFAKNTLVKAEDYAPDIKQALIIIPGLLGVDSTIAKRYMIIMQNDKELRPTGGFWTNYATFRIQDGLLQSDFTSKDFYSIDYAIDVIDAFYDFPDAPAPYAKYLKVERWYARDTNSSPDLPTSIANFMFYYDLGIKYAPAEIKPIDGIITIDTQVIEDLIGLTGPVTVNGLTYTSENVVLELERIASLSQREQINRKGVLGDLMEAMLINVFESDVSIWSDLIDKGVELGVKKHIQAYLFNEEAQVLVEKYNLAGRITDPVEGDYSYVVSTNLGGDKTNWFVSKTVDHALTQENGRWINTVTINYNYPQPGEEYAPFVTRFRDWVRIYTPVGTELISFEGSEDGTGEGEERGKKFYSGYIELAPQESKTITVKYYLPDDLIKDGKYSLLIQKQAGIDTEKHTITINGKTSEIDLTKDEWFSTKL